MQLIKKIAPDLTEEMIKRYRVLKTVRLLQPCGRRLVVLSLGMTERTVRSEIERLSAQALVHISKIGMSLTEEGMEVLEGLETIFSALTGLSILEERLTDALGAQKVFIAQGDSDSSERAKKEMGQLAARVLSENTTEDLRIAIAGGSAMAEAGAGGTGIRCADGEDGTAGAWEHRAQIGAAGGYPCGKTGGKAAGGLSFAAPAG